MVHQALQRQGEPVPGFLVIALTNLRGSTQGDNWNDLLKEVITFNSVEEFWGIYVCCVSYFTAVPHWIKD